MIFGGALFKASHNAVCVVDTKENRDTSTYACCSVKRILKKGAAQLPKAANDSPLPIWM